MSEYLASISIPYYSHLLSSHSLHKFHFHMAQTLKDFVGWDLNFNDNSNVSSPSTPSRRTRRTRGLTLEISITRQSDDFTINAGDFILTQGRNGTELYLIKEIQHGLARYLDLVAYKFLKTLDLCLRDENSSSNEVFITAYLASIDLANIVDKAYVLSYAEFTNEIVLDESNSFNTFHCRKGTDLDGQTFSDEFDFKEFYTLFKTDRTHFHEELKRCTVKTAYKETSKSSPSKRPLPKKTSISPAKLPKIVHNDVSDDSAEDGFVQQSSDSESEDQQSEAEAEEPSPSQTPRKRGRKPKGTPKKEVDKSREYMNSVLLPLKKRLKLKKDNTPNIQALSPSKRAAQSAPLFDTSSKAFQDVKRRLHTSAKLASLPCREEEFASIYINLESAIQERSGCCVYVSGTPGVGKTATIREVIAQLQELVSMKELNDFDYLEINGLKLLNPNAAYERLWEFVSGYKVSATNSALLLENYFSQENNRKPLVVLMDELDQLATKKQNVMYNFFNWPTYEHSHLIVIAVANTMDLPERLLSNKISSRLGLRRIQFVGYTYDQLGTIIQHRLELLTKQNKRKVIIDSDAVGFASRKVASVSGDARRALAICRRAVEIAEEEYVKTTSAAELNNVDVAEQSYRVHIHHISRAINETINSPVIQFLTNLSFGSKLILKALILRMQKSGTGEIALGEVIDEMRNLLVLLTGKHKFDSIMTEEKGLVGFFYGSQLDKTLVTSSKPTNLRFPHFSDIVNQLAESGILTEQSSQSERYRLISLNVSEDEVKTVLDKDHEVLSMG